MSEEKFCLEWNDFQSTVSGSFGTLRREKDFFDVTLVSDDGFHVSSHKVVLSASSEFFKNILSKKVFTCQSSDLSYWCQSQRIRLCYGLHL